MSKSIALTSEALKEVIDVVIKANHTNLAKGNDRVTLNIEGEPGLGKTSIVKQYAKEHDMNFVQVNLAMIEEISDLVGFPIKEYKIRAKKGDKIISKWVPEKTLNSSVSKGWTASGDTRMGYAKPEWLTGHDGKPGILLLDDYSRANPAFMQATMQLVQHGEYISWKLPNNWTVLLTTNPDDGEHSVTSMDDAQKTRFITFNMRYSAEEWAKWAEISNVPSACINFLLLYPEAVVNNNDEGEEKIVINPRRWMMFFNSLSNFNDLSENLRMVRLLGDAAVGDVGANLFVTFINNSLDKLIAPKQMLLGDTDMVISEIKSLIGIGDKYRADIASTLATRFTNYTINYAANNTIDIKITNHIEALFNAEVFGADVNYTIIYNLFSKNKQKFAKLLVKPAILKAMT